jgi:hypothetical protein
MLLTGAYVDDVDEVVRQRLYWVGGLALLAVVIAAIIAFFVARSISRPARASAASPKQHQT